MDDCIFCEIISGNIPAHIVKETENIIVFLSLEGHPLIVPKTHIEDVFSLDKETSANIMYEAVSVSKALRDTLKCDGINLVQSNGVAAGQDVFHFHLHLKPRWRDDDVILRWDTTTVKDEIRSDLAANLKKCFVLS